MSDDTPEEIYVNADAWIPAGDTKFIDGFDTEYRLKSSEDKIIRNLAATLEKNYMVFVNYAKMHMAKNTNEGSEKAHSNLDRAEEIRAALTKHADRIKQAEEKS